MYRSVFFAQKFLNYSEYSCFSDYSNRTESANTGGLVFDEELRDYREEVVMEFYNSMLDIIVDEWTLVEPVPANVDTPSSGSDIVEIKDFRELTQEDLISTGTLEVEGSKVSITKKRRKSSSITGKTKRKSKASTTSRSSSLQSNSGDELKKIMEVSNTERVSHVNSAMLATAECEPQVLLSADSGNVPVVNSKPAIVFIKFKNGNTYHGSIDKKRFDGEGKFVWSNGVVYEGEFKKGKITGRGKQYYKENTYYVGEFCKGMLHGNGTICIADTNVMYSGQWKNGKQDGKGWILYEPQNWYDGEWKEGMKNGIGLRQYNKTARYQGNWLNGKRHGQGTMVWSNRDHYSGEWQNGAMDGYGEYIWKGFFNTQFTFPIVNSYEGQWMNGMRSGSGILHFGYNGGARMAGQWIRNMKHGAGIIVCGNGKTIKGNLLFMYDKPVDMQLFMNSKILSSANKSKSSQSQSREMVSLIEKVEPPLNYDSSNKFCDENEKDLNRINVFSEIPAIYSSQINPLYIPVHSEPQRVDLTYYLQKVAPHYGFEYAIQETGTSQETTTSDNTYQRKILNFEEQKLRSAITYYYLQLQLAYQEYSTIAVKKRVEFRTTLTRLFLWQLYIDCGITKKMSLVDTDLCLLENPNCGLDSEHYPFEKIYFWQFLYSVLSVAWEFYSENCESYKTEGILASIFRKFTKEYIAPNLGKVKGGALCEYVNLLPIQSVYLLYRSLGEPHTVRKFFCSCINKDDIICEKLLTDPNVVYIKKGINAVVTNKPLYVPDDLPIGEKPTEPVPHPFPENVVKSLHIFMKLKPKQLIKCISEQCPKVIEEDVIVNMDYKVSFLEFYNILLATAFKMVDDSKKLEQKHRECRAEESIISNSSKQTKPSKKNHQKKGKK